MPRIYCIRPYRSQGTWVFDDPSVELVHEPFVMGVPEMIDEMIKSIPGAVETFQMRFSASSFPGAKAPLHRVREGEGGHWYRWDERGMEGWLCPALFRYFDAAPREIHFRVDPDESRGAPLE